MKKYGESFYGSDEVHALLGRQPGEWQLEGSQDWQCGDDVSFRHPSTSYKLPIAHWFYRSGTFKRTKKPSDEKSPLRDFDTAALWVELARRDARYVGEKPADEITLLARKACADIYNYPGLKADIMAGDRDKTTDMRLAKAAVIAGIELQKGRKT